MQINCPCCGAEFEVEAKTTIKGKYPEYEMEIIKSFFYWLKGREYCKGEFKKVDNHYLFYMQVEDSPEGDTWVNGKIEWWPGVKIKISDTNFSAYRGFGE